MLISTAAEVFYLRPLLIIYSMPLISADNGKRYKRIVSLVPSQTELLYYFGLDEKVIGITKFCVHPQLWFKTKKKVGGTKTINIELVRQLQPDLIIANKEENEKSQIEMLANDFDVSLTDVKTLPDALSMIMDIGKLTNNINKAVKLVSKIQNKFSLLKNTKPKIAAVYLIWRHPYMTIGGDTFINDMMYHGGLENVFSKTKRYPEITIEELQNSNCQLILLSSEPYPFKQKHIDELNKYMPEKKIILADGEMFSWYGNRLVEAPSYFKQLIAEL